VAQRKFDRLTKQIKPDMVAYTQQKLEQGDDFYRDSNSLVYGQYDKVDPERLEAMVQDLKKQYLLFFMRSFFLMFFFFVIHHQQGRRKEAQSQGRGSQRRRRLHQRQQQAVQQVNLARI